MIKLYRYIKFFSIYRKNIINNKKYLLDKYGLEYNRLYELYTTIILTDAPDEMKQQYGSALAEHEIKKYISEFNYDLPKLELEELVNVYEIKKLDNPDYYGITFGFSLISNRKLYWIILGLILGLITITTLGIILI